MLKKIFITLSICCLSLNAHAFGQVLHWGGGHSGGGGQNNGGGSSSSVSSQPASSSSSSSVSSASSSSSSVASSSSSVSSISSSSSSAASSVSSSSSSVSSVSSSSSSVASSSSSAASTGGDVLPVATSSSEIKGLDVYHGDDITSWSGLVSGGIQFMAAKATESTDYEDASYPTNQKNAHANGIIFGAYHFIHLDVDPVAQADYFANYINANGGLAPTDFVMLDWETASGDPYSVSGDPGTIQSFLNEVKAKLGRRCFVYVGYYMVEEVNNPSFLSEYPFWLADYNSTPLIPAPWKTWNVWQTSGSANIQGLGNQGDSDTFHGSLSDLQALINYTIVN